MIEFQRLTLAQREAYNQILFSAPFRGCEYSFANLFLWGKQQVAFRHGCVAFFAHFYGRSVYPYPIGNGDRRLVLEEILEDARQRGIPCRITGMTQADAQELESWFPGAFHIRPNRDGADYVYDIQDLADLRGRKFQKKRNHFNRFQAAHPEYTVVPITGENLAQAEQMAKQWYARRKETDPEGDYFLESVAMDRVFRSYEELGMEGLLLMEGDRVLALTMGSPMGPETFDIHFEKAREDVDGAYNAINCEFARYLRGKYPQLRFLDREDDMGLEGLRKAKLSYNPAWLQEKFTACCREDLYGPCQ